MKIKPLNISTNYWIHCVLAVGLGVAVPLVGEGLSRAHFDCPAPTPILYDRHGNFLAQLGDHEGTRVDYGFWPIAEIPDRVARATLALEDRRFADHPGVDIAAILRAGWQHLRGGRSGASTIAMQLARMQHPEARNLWTKAVETVTALALTARYGRQAVLAHYLQMVPYGNGSHGIAHAARWYFDKPVADLSWAEIALLSAIPQAPANDNPLRADGLRRARVRAARSLDLLAAQHVILPDELAMARAQLAQLAPPAPPPRPALALHAILRIQRLLATQALPNAADPRIRTSLDLDWQREVARLSLRALDEWHSQGAQQVAVMVVRRDTHEVLAAIGSAGYRSRPAGMIDFSDTMRSPGSTLKPFLYADALARDVLSPSQVMQDLPDMSEGIGNADGAFLGTMLPRQALANSRNVPAVLLLRALGMQHAFDRLRDLGIHDFDGSAARFGLSLAIGSLPTTLSRLMRAYGALSDDGRESDLVWFRGEDLAPPRQALPVSVARQVALFLADPMARLPSFARYGSVEYPFTVSLKTGTSQGYRDAWLIGWSRDYEVGVWVGRADSGPMSRLSGALSAADLAQKILLRLHGAGRLDLQAGEFAHPVGSQAVELCATTGAVAGPRCPARLLELMPAAAPTRRPDPDGVQLSIVSPEPNVRIWRNPEAPAAANRLVLRARVEPPVRQVVWQVDGVDFAIADPLQPVFWPMSPGPHRFQIRLPLQPGRSAPVRIVVE